MVLQPELTGAAAAPVSSVDLQACGLAKSFGAVQIFRDVNFSVGRAEAVSLVGANGAGKSTLLRCAMGLIPVDAGTVAVLGDQIAGVQPRKLRTLRSQIGLVSQKHNLVPRLSVLSNVVHGLLGMRPGIRHWSQMLAPSGSRTAAMEALERVGLAGFASRRSDQLSGGQSQRVAIARALVARPKILIADEHRNTQWKEIEADSKWLVPEPDVVRWAEGLAPGVRILDLGAGVGRHALALAENGFDVTAVDAAPEGLAAIEAAGAGVATKLCRMHDLPFEAGAFDHVLSWNVIYHGDENILLTTIAEIRRVLQPGGTYLGAMLSKRRLPHELAKYPGHEISRNAWTFDAPGTDKIHPHYFCSALDLLALFQGFEIKWPEDREHERTGSYHWHLILERL